MKKSILAMVATATIAFAGSTSTSVPIMNPKNRTSKFSNLISKCYN